MFQAPLSSEQETLGSNSDRVDWIEADVTAEWSWKSADIWHDRAVFHFLTDPCDRARYQAHLKAMLKRRTARSLRRSRQTGPQNAGGLPVVRYSPESLASELGPDFALVQSMTHEHQKPWDSTQSFQYSRFVKRAG
jgi:hypothetical protein